MSTTHKNTTLGDQLPHLAGFPADTPLLVPGPDHTYRPAVVRVTTAIHQPETAESPGGWFEDAGDGTPGVVGDPGQGERRLVVVIYGDGDVGSRP